LGLGEAGTGQTEGHAERQDGGHQRTADTIMESGKHVGLPLLLGFLRTRFLEPFAVPYRVKSILLLAWCYAEARQPLQTKMPILRPKSRCSLVPAYKGVTIRRLGGDWVDAQAATVINWMQDGSGKYAILFASASS
jgi:hypothetical protein